MRLLPVKAMLPITNWADCPDTPLLTGPRRLMAPAALTWYNVVPTDTTTPPALVLASKVAALTPRLPKVALAAVV